MHCSLIALSTRSRHAVIKSQCQLTSFPRTACCKAHTALQQSRAEILDAWSRRHHWSFQGGSPAFVSASHIDGAGAGAAVGAAAAVAGAAKVAMKARMLKNAPARKSPFPHELRENSSSKRALAC